jgi:type VI protein secretion system component Hcp
MREQDVKKRSSRSSYRADEQNNASSELGDAELQDVSGGKVTMQDFNFTKKMDKSSSTL